jgi:hypothetical protein
LTTVTTVASFASLMIASHRGLNSLGRVMTLGVTFSLITSLVTLPAIFVWLSRKREVKSASEPEEVPASELQKPTRAMRIWRFPEQAAEIHPLRRAG